MRVHVFKTHNVYTLYVLMSASDSRLEQKLASLDLFDGG